MYYCDPCAQKNRYPESWYKVNTICELCGQDTTCNMVDKSHIPQTSLESRTPGRQISHPWRETEYKQPFKIMNPDDPKKSS